MFILVTSATNKTPLYLNTDTIIYFNNQSSQNTTYIQLIEDEYLVVVESAESIYSQLRKEV